MIRLTLVLIALLFFNACSLKTPKNDWQRKSTNAFSSYTKNFLNGDDALAYNDLSRAIKHAKQSANLTQLAKIYLGECALNISVGIEDACSEYKNISDLVLDKELDAYYSFLTDTLKKDQIQFLPKHYQKFASAFIAQDKKLLNKEIVQIPKETSSYISAALTRKDLSHATKMYLIESASSNGYKKLVLFWLQEAKRASRNPAEIQLLNKKISILNSDK